MSTAAKTSNHHPEFTLLETHAIPALQLSIEHYRHAKTGAEHYHLNHANEENVFLVALRTVPTDSTGVAHILEHTALCGSERYPVRDPFFLMLRRSLNTFMNAFTSSDWTAYPFASMNRKDFTNLLQIYLDAVFFSRLDKLDFLQEGHRVELSDPNDLNSPLVYKGVVYNEMKGAMSSPTSQLWHTLCKYLYPVTTYHYNSGGEPNHIPDLSYDALKAFYKKHYHPSNSIFMTFGNIPASTHQQYFDDLVLKRFKADPDLITVPSEKRLYAPIRVAEHYPIDDPTKMQKKTHIVMAWLLGESTDILTHMKTQLLIQVLIANSAAPLLHALETCEFAEGPSPLCGSDDSQKEMCFVCGIEGSEPEHADQLEELVLKVLKDVAENGVPQSQVESVLHQLELHQREITGANYPYGLQLILSALPTAIHRGNVSASLDIDRTLQQLHTDIQDPNFIKNLCRDLLLNNPHRVRLTLAPDANLSHLEEAAIKEALAAHKKQLSEAEIQQIIAESEALKARQEQEEDLSVLPTVTLHDVPKETKVPEGKVVPKQWTMHQYDQGTNGIAYQNIVMPLSDLTERQLSLLPFYTGCIGELGVGSNSYPEQQAHQAAISGGINAASLVRNPVNDVTSISGVFTLSSKALYRNIKAMTELLYQTMNALRFDEHDHILDLLSQMRLAKEQAITGSGHTLAMIAACQNLSPGGKIAHELQGLKSTQQLISLDKHIKENNGIEKFAHELQEIHHTLMHNSKEFLLIAESAALPLLENAVLETWAQEKNHQSQSQLKKVLQATQPTIQQLWVTNTQVNFVASAYPTVPVSHPDAPVLAVLANFLKNGYLHRAIREQGGAYGGGASHDPDVGAFKFYSYRDPRLTETLSDFTRSVDWLMSTVHRSDALEEAILGIVAAIDKPSSPAAEAKNAYFNNHFGRTKAQRQEYRERLLAVTIADIQRVAAHYLTPERANTAIITNQTIASSNEHLGYAIERL